MTSADNVVLFSGEISPGTTGQTDASLDEVGDLVVATQDLGGAPQEIFGDSDYEWWIVVRAANRQELLARLLDQQVERTTAGGRDEGRCSCPSSGSASAGALPRPLTSGSGWKRTGSPTRSPATRNHAVAFRLAANPDRPVTASSNRDP